MQHEGIDLFCNGIIGCAFGIWCVGGKTAGSARRAIATIGAVEAPGFYCIGFNRIDLVLFLMGLIEPLLDSLHKGNDSKVELLKE